MIARILSALRDVEELPGLECVREQLARVEPVLRGADRYAAGLCATGSALLLTGDEAAAMRQAAVDRVARTHFDGRDARSGSLAVIPEADASTDSDPEGVLFPIQSAYGEAGFYVGLAVGLRLAAMTSGEVAAPRRGRA